MDMYLAQPNYVIRWAKSQSGKCKLHNPNWICRIIHKWRSYGTFSHTSLMSLLLRLGGPEVETPLRPPSSPPFMYAVM